MTNPFMNMSIREYFGNEMGMAETESAEDSCVVSTQSEYGVQSR